MRDGVRAFLLIVLPLIAPGILAGGILGFAKAMGEFGATITFVANIPGQTQTLPSAIYAFLQVPGGEGSALRLVILSVIVALGRRVYIRLVGATRWQTGYAKNDFGVVSFASV